METEPVKAMVREFWKLALREVAGAPIPEARPPSEHYSAAIRYGSEESLDQLLAAEDPDVGSDDDGRSGDTGWDENATEERRQTVAWTRSRSPGRTPGGRGRGGL